jgi:5-enolpyruvylshikimate-3-phosphate synthase
MRTAASRPAVAAAAVKAAPTGVAHISHTKKGAAPVTVAPGGTIPLNRVNYVSSGISAQTTGALTFLADGTYTLEYSVTATPTLGGTLQAGLFYNGTTPMSESQRVKSGRPTPAETTVKGHIIAAFPDARAGFVTGAGSTIELKNTSLVPIVLSARPGCTFLKCVQLVI